jgi:wee1-like protein kinase
LSLERQKNELLLKKLRESTRIIKSYETSRTPGKARPAPNDGSLVKSLFTFSVGKKAKPVARDREPQLASDRKLRSYSRKRQRFAAMNDRRNLRDRNKTTQDLEDH